MAPLEQEMEVAAVTAVQLAYNANQAPIEAAIAALEGGAEALLANGLKNLAAQKTGGVIGSLLPSIESLVDSEITTQAQALIAKYGPSVVYALGQRELDLALAAAQKG